ncbi:MAG: caspase family protein [Flammeovirgaceae bacterium]|nr:caspase family protein [Flammeovirgaceae bacterium]
MPKILGYNDEPIRSAKELDELSLYPEIDLLHPDLNGGKLGIELTDQGGGIGRVVILINDKEISNDVRDASMVGKNHDAISLSYEVLEHPFVKEADLNKISIKAYNKNGDLVSRTKNLYLLPSGNPIKKQPEFYAVIAGVSDYKGTELDLKFAAKDATDIAVAIKLSATQYLGGEHTHISVLTTDNPDAMNRPTKKNIFNTLDDIAKKADANDILFIYLAGHGVNYGGENGDFYYLTEDASNGILVDQQVRESVAISSNEFSEIIRKIPSVKQVLILDACHSGKLASDLVKKRTMSSSDVRALETLKDRTGLYVLAGSAADALSYESSQYGQGLLTYSLLFGIKGPALRQNEYVDILKLFQFATEKVPELAADIGGIQKPEIRIPTESSSFDVGKLSEEERSKINLNTPKPVFVRSEFQDESQFLDVVELSVLLDEALKNSTKDGAVELVYVDSRKFDNAFSLKGRYTQADNQITCKIKLFREKLMIAEFELRAATAEKLSQLILKEAIARIAN